MSPVYLVKNISDANKVGLFNTIKFQEYQEIYLDEEEAIKELATNAEYFNFNLSILDKNPNSVGALDRVNYQVEEFKNIINLIEEQNLKSDEETIKSLKNDIQIYNNKYKIELKKQKKKRIINYTIVSLVLAIIVFYFFYPKYKEHLESPEDNN